MNKFFTDDIICAPATVPGTGAISIVRVSGNGCIELVDRILSLKKGKLSEALGYTLHYGTVFYTPEDENPARRGDAGVLSAAGMNAVSVDCREKEEERPAEVLDDVIVSVFRAPHSYTGEDALEISCHASKFIVSELLRLLVAAGCRLAGPGEFTQRAFLNGKMDLAQAEAVADVIASSSEASHRIAMSQMKGGFSKELVTMRSEMLELATLMELELDFSEEDVEFADRTRLTGLVDKTAEHIRRLMDSFRLGNAIRNGVPTVIVGATNAGKSTLLNALLGEERAIVSDIDGTTRDTIEETLNIGGILFRFIDTAGLRESTDEIERIGIERSYRKLAEAMVVIVMLDATKTDGMLSAEFSALLPLVDFRQQKLFVVLNKIDAISPDDCFNKNVIIENTYVSYLEGSNDDDSTAETPELNLFQISTKSGRGLSELKSALADSQKSQNGASSEQTLVTNLRHYQALASTSEALARVRLGLADSVPTDLLVQDLREGIDALGEIVGVISSQEVLNTVFSRFCVGK